MEFVGKAKPADVADNVNQFPQRVRRSEYHVDLSENFLNLSNSDLNFQ